MTTDAMKTSTDRVSGLKRELRDAARNFRFSAAEVIYEELTQECGVDPDSDDMLAPRVMIGLRNDRLLEMMQMLNGLGEDRALNLKAICLQMLGDPSWDGMAQHVEETTDDPRIRRSMQSLLKARET